MYQTLGFLELSDGRPSVAIGHLEPLWRSDVAAKRPVSIGERYVGDLVEAACAAGAIELATDVLATIETDLRVSQRPWVLLIAARGRALLAAANGEPDLAAIEAARRIGDRHEVADALRAWPDRAAGGSDRAAPARTPDRWRTPGSGPRDTSPGSGQQPGWRWPTPTSRGWAGARSRWTT